MGRVSSLSDYALIGDCRSAALVSRTGSIDWLCWPRFDSPSIFGALLDDEKGGRFVVRPVGPFEATRRYVSRTNVLETTFRTPKGVLRLTDLMPVDSERAKDDRLVWPQNQILRIVDCLEGEVEVTVDCDPRPDYGRCDARLRDRGALGFYYEHRGHVLVLRSDLPLRLTERGDPCGQERLRAGARRRISLVFSEGEPAILPLLGDEADKKLAVSRRWWEEWSARCRYDGPHRDAVLRSALVLKLMTYAPSGAVVAAPTTSLPEQPGGTRNWDYRFCWLRDASFTLRSLFGLGYRDEAEAFLAWLLHTTRISRPELATVYDVYGETRLKERRLDRLSGYQGAQPVRVGNAAEGQFQLDVYGEVIDAVYEFVRRGGRLDRYTGRMLAGFGETVCRRWREPDEGIWELRAGRFHHTYSKVMCWVALDRLLGLASAGHLHVPTDTFARERAAIRAEVERRGFNEALGSYVSTFGGEDVDASLLLIGRHGFVPPDAPRMTGTARLIRDRLGTEGLLYRYRFDDGLPGREGAFGISSFWAVSGRADEGDREEAEREFEKVLGYANDVGLFGEEIDPATGEPLGNFPQAFTHVGLIHTALDLAGHAEGIGEMEGARL